MNKDSIVRQYSNVIKAYTNLRRQLSELEDVCEQEDNKELARYVANVINETEDYYEETLNVFEDDMLDNLFPIDFADNSEEQTSYIQSKEQQDDMRDLIHKI